MPHPQDPNISSQKMFHRITCIFKELKVYQLISMEYISWFLNLKCKIFSADPSLTLVSEAPPDLKVQHVHIIQRIRQYTVKKLPSLYSVQLFIEVVTCEMIYLYSAPNIMKVKLISGIYLEKTGFLGISGSLWPKIRRPRGSTGGWNTIAIHCPLKNCPPKKSVLR